MTFINEYKKRFTCLADGGQQNGCRLILCECDSGLFSTKTFELSQVEFASVSLCFRRGCCSSCNTPPFCVVFRLKDLAAIPNALRHFYLCYFIGSNKLRISAYAAVGTVGVEFHV